MVSHCFLTIQQHVSGESRPTRITIGAFYYNTYGVCWIAIGLWIPTESTLNPYWIDIGLRIAKALSCVCWAISSVCIIRCLLNRHWRIPTESTLAYESLLNWRSLLNRHWRIPTESTLAYDIARHYPVSASRLYRTSKQINDSRSRTQVCYRE